MGYTMNEFTAYQKQIEDLSRANQALQREVEELRRDKERLDWLFTEKGRCQSYDKMSEGERFTTLYDRQAIDTAITDDREAGE